MSFIENIRRAQEAAKTRPQSREKDLSSLSLEELDQELAKAQERLQGAKRREIVATREAAADAGSGKRWLPLKRNRRAWK